MRPTRRSPLPVAEVAAGSVASTRGGNVSKVTERIAQFQFARQIGYDGWERYQNWKTLREERSKFYLTVEDDDRLWDELRRWYAVNMPEGDRRSLLGITTHSSQSTDDWFDDMMSPVAGRDTGSGWAVLTAFDGEHEFYHDFNGARVLVKQTDRKPDVAQKKRPSGIPDLTSEVSDAISYYRGEPLDKYIVFECISQADRDKVVTFLNEMSTALEKTNPRFYMYTANGFRSRSNTKSRPIESVILPEHDRQTIVDDFTKFIASESRYSALGIPWHRGYLFEGPPGTGKTSLAAGLADEFKFDMYFLPLSSVESDAKLHECVGSISGSRMILVLEDVDVVSAAQGRVKDDTKGVTLAGLLNVLDGLSTPHGMIAIMTTNHVETLDPALIRPGRADVRLNMSYMTDEQLQQMCDKFGGGHTFNLPKITSNITPAEVVGVFKSTDPEKIEADLIALLNQKNYVQTTSERDNVASPTTTTDGDKS